MVGNLRDDILLPVGSCLRIVQARAFYRDIRASFAAEFVALKEGEIVVVLSSHQFTSQAHVYLFVCSSKGMGWIWKAAENLSAWAAVA